MSTLLTLRQDLAVTLGAALDGTNVYAFPADVVALPAVVILPGDPYWIIETFGGGSGNNQFGVNLDLQVLVKRANVESALAKLEELAATTSLAITTADQPWYFMGLATPEQVDVGGQEAILATIAVRTRLSNE